MLALGIDLGGTKVLAALVRGGEVLDRRLVDTPQTGFSDVVDAIHSACAPLLDAARRSGESVVSAGIGSPGPLDYKRGVVVFAPNIAGMVDAPLVSAVEAKLGLAVELENDANAAGYGEHLYGAAHGYDSSFYLTLSTGIGGGVFIGDRLIRGANGLAGEIGHMTLLPGGPLGGDGIGGSLEAIAAGRSIARDASYAYGQPLRTPEVFDRARAGERMALAIIDNSARFAGIGIANVVKTIDPAVIVIGGGLTRAGPFYLDRVLACAESYLEGYPKPEFKLAELGDDAGVIGAAAAGLKAAKEQGRIVGRRA